MSAATTIGQNESASAPRDPSGVRAKSLRVWPVVVLLVLFWAFLYANHTAEMSMFARFLSRLAAYGVMLLVFLGWWLTRSSIRWRDRLLAIVVTILAGVLAWLVADKSINGFGLFMSAFPVVMSVWVIWLVVSRSLLPTLQRTGFCAAMLVAFGYFTLLRFDGLDAMQKGEMSWRWTPTKEQIFLTSHSTAANPGKNENGATAKPWTQRPGDCLEFRGPQRDGIIERVALDTDWTAHPPKLLWRQKVGPAWSGMIVVDGHVVTQEQRGDVEAVVCYDAATGKEVWAHDDKIRFEESLSGAGPRGTPTFADGRIYALGGKGILNCLTPETGKVIWSHDIVADAGVEPGEIPIWGYSNSPLVVDDLVIVFAGGKKEKSVLAYQADDGKLAWSRAGGSHSYSSPQVVTLHGQKQILMHDNLALRGLKVADGTVLWEYASGDENSFPMLQPHVIDSDSLVIAIEPNALLLKIERDGDKWSATPGWSAKAFRPAFSDFVTHAGCIYGLNDGVLCCYDLATGERLWKKGRLSHGQLIMLADQNTCVVSSEKGEIILVSVDRAGYKELGRIQAIEGKTWNGPVLAGGQLFLRNTEEMAAFDLSIATPADGERAAAQP